MQWNSQHPGKEKPAPCDLHNAEDHMESPAHREISTTIRIKMMSNRRLPLCRKNVGLHLTPVRKKSPTSPEISQPWRSLVGNPILNSHKLYDPRSQKENVRSLQGLPKNAGKWKLHLSVAGQNFRLLPLVLLVPHSFSKASLPSLRLPSAMDLAPRPLKRPRFLSFSPPPLSSGKLLRFRVCCPAGFFL